MRRYNVTPSQYAAALARGCEVCGRLGVELHIDHDHACCPGNYTCGKCVRGYLCGSCNRMLGLASDDVTTVLAAANYLMRSRDVLACAPTLTDRKE
ncbi:endonuclease domain-containing protein [Tsukamurella sp. DT100]|uniref:endonuclease domain-containing protein n=1 Tax=Tsukamurella sp. DT100 TaxID=3393415 RepID=UPI003CEF22E9